MEVEYDAGTDVVNVSGIVPGDIVTKEFDIIIRPTNIENEATYAIKLDISSNTFVKCDDTNYDSITNACTQDVEELVYRLKDSDNETIAEGTLMGMVGEQILAIETKTVESNTTYHYTLEIEFVETNADQNHNMNKEFNGRVIVEFSGELLREQILADNGGTNTIEAKGIPNFSQAATTDEGMYAAEDNDGISYYYRGAVDNNWVSFAGFYWRIIRINEDGSIRMIYSGEDTGSVTEANITGESTQIGTSAFNSSDTDNMYVGYMYTSEQVHGLGTSSTIKGVLDQWYEDSLQTNYAQYLSTEAGFCGDRTSTTTNGGEPNDTGGTGTTTTYYGARYRLYTNKTPTFECPDESNDLYTVASASSGNNSLDYPIGLATADEVAYAGGVHRIDNTEYYLYTNQNYWAMSPSYFSEGANILEFYIGSNLATTQVYNELGIRPVINLASDVTISEGDGTSNNPYRIEVR